jgi:hypothetical protein
MDVCRICGAARVRSVAPAGCVSVDDALLAPAGFRWRCDECARVSPFGPGNPWTPEKELAWAKARQAGE